MAAQRGGKKFRFKNKLMSLDSSVIDLSMSLFDWAKFRRTKGAIKLHLLLDHDGYLPSFAVITEGKSSDIKVARQMRFEPGTVLAIDRGYMDYDWFVELTRQGVYFVSRLKRNAVVEVIEDRPVPKNRNILKDQVVFFPHHAQAREEYLSPPQNLWVVRRPACNQVIEKKYLIVLFDGEYSSAHIRRTPTPGARSPRRRPRSPSPTPADTAERSRGSRPAQPPSLRGKP